MGKIDFYGSRKHFFFALQARFSFNYGFKNKKRAASTFQNLALLRPTWLCVLPMRPSLFSACALPHGISSSVSGGSLCACALVWLSGYKCGSYIETKWLELFQCWGYSLSRWYVCVSFHRAVSSARVS